MRIVFFLGIFFISFCAFGQGTNLTLRSGESERLKDSIQEPPVSAYKIISIKGDTTHLDTTLTIKRAYKFNYLRKDGFETLPFSNVGRPYTRFGYTFSGTKLMPSFGARARHANYMEVEDIDYYHVPRAWTEFMFKTTFEQGQILDVFFTMNTTPRLNFSIAYKGVRSLGKYQHILNSSGNLRTSLNYHTKNNRYFLKTHFTSQDLMNQENGGLTPKALNQFLNQVEEFNDRSLLEVKFRDAQNKLLGKRFYLNHYYVLNKGADSTQNHQITIGHILNVTDKEFHFKQDKASPWFGPTYEDTNLYDEVEFQEFSNTAYLDYHNKTLGRFKIKAKHVYFNYGYKRLLILDNMRIPNRLSGNVFAAGASYAKKIGSFDFQADAMLNISGDFSGNYIKAALGFQLSEDSYIRGVAFHNAKAPNYNFLLYQSDYKNYNWRHHFDNVKTQGISLQLKSPEWVDLEVNYTQITDHAYFKLTENTNPAIAVDSLVKPFQYGGTLKYFKIKADKTFDLGLFALDNTLMYQKVLDGDKVFHVPSFVTRNSLYYKDYWFKKAMYLQTGFTLNYFTSYKANGYDPVLAEFYVQNQVETEGFYTVDFFFNAKVSQARIYFKLENLSSLLTGNTNLVAPGYTYRDFSIRFGLVWDVFM